MEPYTILRELESLGTAQNRKVYRRHGVGENQYGVSYAHLGALKKKLKTNHSLALALWASGNHDARVLATMIADPAQMTSRDLDAWVRDLDNYTLTEQFARFVAATPHARAKMEQWTRAPGEWPGEAGWSLLASLALKAADLPEAFFRPYLKTIQTDIHRRQNWVRYAMNNALIAIGLRSPALRQEALAIAAVIGRVEVDHGETNCRTPDAVSYIQKAAARQKA